MSTANHTYIKYINICKIIIDQMTTLKFIV